MPLSQRGLTGQPWACVIHCMGAEANHGAEPKPGETKKGARKKKPLCFVISPFGDWYDRYYLDIYKPAVEAAGFEAKRADDLYRPSAIVHDIWDYVRASRVMLADLTAKNPNVFYELGLAHAKGKPVVLLTQSMEDVPFDLRALRVIEYEVEDPAWSAVLRVKIQKALEEVLDSPEQAVLPTFLQQGGKGQPPTSRTPLEKRVLELQREVSLLRSGPRAHEIMLEPRDADRMIVDLVRRGMPENVIVAEVARLGPPPMWIRRQIRAWRRRLRVPLHRRK